MTDDEPIRYSVPVPVPTDVVRPTHPGWDRCPCGVCDRWRRAAGKYLADLIDAEVAREIQRDVDKLRPDG